MHFEYSGFMRRLAWHFEALMLSSSGGVFSRLDRGQLSFALGLTLGDNLLVLGELCLLRFVAATVQ